MATIAVDAGTSVIKAVAFSGDGREIGLARVSTQVLHPQADRSEQSMDSVWEAVVHTVREVAGNLSESVTALCITAQGDGCWLVDAEGNPTGNALLWNDARASAAVEQWRSHGKIE